MLRSLLVLTSLTCLSASLVAQSPDDMGIDTELLDLLELLNTPVQGASKREQRLIESPQAIEVLTGDEIRQMGIYRLADALALMTSVDVLELDNQATNVTLRGAMQQGWPRTVQILLDGVPLYNGEMGSVDIDNIPVPVDLIDRVEVVRGPSSSLYGANAVVGVIAITTKHGGKAHSGSARVTKASDGKFRGAATLMLAKDAWSLSTGYSGASQPTKIIPARNLDNQDQYGVPEPYPLDDNSSHQRSIYARGQYTTEATKFWLSAGQSAKKYGISIDHRVNWFPYLQPETHTFQGGWNQKWAEGFRTELRASRMEQQVYTSGDKVFGFQDHQAWLDFKNDLVELQINWDPSQKFHVVAGGDYRKSRAGKVDFLGLESPRKESASGGFLNLDWNPIESLTLSAGARAENESLGGSRVSPRGVIVWNPNKSSSLRAGYYSSTRSPQILESHINLNVPFELNEMEKAYLSQQLGVPPEYGFLLSGVFNLSPNTSLEPEKVSSVEVGYRQQIGPVTIDLTAFQMKFSKLVAQVPKDFNPVTDLVNVIPPDADHPLGQHLLFARALYVNKDDSTNTGFEAAAKWAISQKFTVGANFTWMDYEMDTTKQTPGYVPEFKGNLWTRFSYGPWSTYFAYQYIGKVDVEVADIAGNPSKPVPRDAIHQFHANIGYDLGKGFRLGTYVRNAARAMTMLGGGGPARSNIEQGARREIGGTLSWRF